MTSTFMIKIPSIAIGCKFEDQWADKWQLQLAQQHMEVQT